MEKKHHYGITTQWTGNLGQGTSSYKDYSRNHLISAENKMTIPGSSDPAFRGDAARYNPEELLVASLSACHMLWYLHLCAEVGIVVVDYIDRAKGTMTETPDSGGYFSEVVLCPAILVADASMIELANTLHHKANSLCFIANSCKFPVYHNPTYRTT